MRRRVVLGVFALAASLASASTQAAVVTVDVTIKAVNLQARGITVVYKTELGEKTIELDVSRKAEITVNGKEGTLDSLGPGLTGKVAFDKDLAVVTKIEAKGKVVQPAKAPELLAVAELNAEGENVLGDLSQDGLTVYWLRWDESKKGSSNVWTAHRDDPQSFFATTKELIPGGVPAISPDGLQMVFSLDRSDGQKGFSLHSTTRADLDKPFERASEILELAKYFTGAPSFSSDGLTLYFSCRWPADSSGKRTIVSSVRNDTSSRWSTPKPIEGPKVAKGSLGNPCVAADGLHLFCDYFPESDDESTKGEKGNLMVWSRTSTDKPFGRGAVIELKGLPPLYGSQPRYVAATNELFFTRHIYEGKKAWKQRKVLKHRIWVVKNFTLPD